MNVRYRVELSQSERDELVGLVSGGKLAVRRLKRMQILLAADDDIAASVQTSGSTIYRTKKRFVEISLEAALSEEPRPGAARKLSGKQEVQCIGPLCNQPCLPVTPSPKVTEPSRSGRGIELHLAATGIAAYLKKGRQLETVAAGHGLPQLGADGAALRSPKRPNEL